MFKIGNYNFRNILADSPRYFYGVLDSEEIVIVESEITVSRLHFNAVITLTLKTPRDPRDITNPLGEYGLFPGLENGWFERTCDIYLFKEFVGVKDYIPEMLDRIKRA